MADENRGQAAYWNGPIGKTWAREYEKRDRDHAEMTRALIAFAAPQSGEHVLDLGCGSGTTTLKIAELVGANGSSTGIDLSGPMIEVARERALAGKSRAVFFEADATDYKFAPRSLDLIFSQFGVMFFADPIAAFTNLYRALKPGGRIAFCCWRSFDENPWANVPEGAARPFLPPQPPADPNAPGRYSFANPDRVKSVLLQASFYAPEFHKIDASVLQGATPEEAASSAIDSGPLMRTLADADDATREKVRAAVIERLAKEKGPNGVYLTQACWLVRARA